ncbi:hypothetical protein IPZ58_02555 [Streptomyces roseoverticillatus]|uniref:hypothetical protein n=1 Tax=Streptomyces roseoverticillatus TaxID=66429 RepID=UPI001F484A67|nr:hypothetical protein [Streptomyces roseoverticillatus]MCF3100463.1 hypothetical protein [Streptomyces roseoverticillatus]
MSDETADQLPARTVRDVLNELPREARILVQKVINLENENIHIRETSKVVPKIIDAVRELTK